MTAASGVEAPHDLLGRVAVSRLGRDAGAVYIVIRVERPGVVFVADGRSRSVARPKRKNLKHLDLGVCTAALAARLSGGETPTDEEIRAAIAAATG